ncbi:MAG TPA: transglycosylase domain-containing protein [Luteolibacter sp.]
MPKRPSPEPAAPSGAKSHARSEGPGALSLLLFWPFHLFQFATRGLSFPWRWLARLVGHPCVAGLYAFTLLAVVYGSRSTRFDLNKIHAMPERSIILDRNGEELGRIHGEKRDVIPLSQVSETFRKAIIAREDERFYRHGAIDPVGMVRALTKNFQGKREGASTITQQLASDVFQLKLAENEKADTHKPKEKSGRKSWPQLLDRKLLEIAIAVRIEATMKKDDILEAYLNSINWGRQIRGIEEASRIYFEKHASELTLPESAMLAGIVRGPDAYNPFRNMKAALRERDTTLDRMVDAGSISRDEAEAAKKEKPEVRPESRRKYQDSYAMDAIRRDLEIILERENIELGGLTITTTIDNRVQKVAEEALDKRLRSVERQSGYAHPTRAAWQKRPEDKRGEANYLQGSVVVFENQTGAALAIVGGRDANESKFNRALQADRQLGSIFKPFVYLAAFDQGLQPDTLISDGPIARGEIKGAPANWHPQNSDNTFGGMQPVSYGLIRSRNTMSIRVGDHAGMPRVKEVARQVGFSNDFPPKPSSYLGSWEATPWEVASAYTVFPNDGQRYKPYLIREIRDREGNILYAPRTISYQATRAGSAWSVSRILNEVTIRGTAASVKRLGFDKPCAGKTGTTNDFKDAWFAGYTSSLTCTVWVGLDTPQKTVSGGYGGTLALPVWVEVMKAADRLGYRAADLHRKTSLLELRLCRQSGKRATSGCEAANSAYTDNVPADIAPSANDLCPLHPIRAIPVDEENLPPVRQDYDDIAPSFQPLRAQPVDDDYDTEAPSPVPLRAQPVEEE